MSHLGVVLLSFVLSLVSPATTEIERAFRRNEPDLLKPLLARGSFLNVSFSSPVLFSDLLSDEQAVLWFGRFFRSHRTVGFYPESPAGRSLAGGSFVYKARWEIEARDRQLIAFDILFLLRPQPEAGRGRRSGGFWKIVQIRAERR